MKLDQFKDKVDQWFTFLEVERNLAVNTISSYQVDMRQFVSFWERIRESETDWATIPIDQIVRRYVVALYYKKMSKPSLARKISCLRSFAQFARSQGIQFSIEAKRPKIDKKLPITLSVDEVFYLLDIKPEALPSKLPHRDKALFEVLYATGARCSEVVSIKLDDVDFSEKTIRIMGKGRRERMLLFGDKAKKAIKLYINKERRDLFRLKKCDYLFLNKNGGSVSSRSLQRVFEMFRRLLKVDRKLTPHKLRHSFATHMLNQGVDIRVVQELLGHRTLSTTEIYTHVSSAALAEMCDTKHPLNKKKQS
jgi:integrase/recombinase XerC